MIKSLLFICVVFLSLGGNQKSVLAYERDNQDIEMRELQLSSELKKVDSDPYIAAMDEILDQFGSEESLPYAIARELEQKERSRSTTLFLFSLIKNAASYTWSTGEKVWGYLSYPFSAKSKESILPL